MTETKRGLPGLAPRRKAAGFTQAGLAVALGVSRALLAAWEAGNLWPSSERLPRMAELLGCGIADLYEPPAEEFQAVEDAEPGNDILPQEGGADHAGELQEYLL